MNKMVKGLKVRSDIHEILFRIYKYNINVNNRFVQNIISKHKEEDIRFINNVVLNSMRYQFHTKKIISRYVKKKLKDDENILLISSVTQIVFLGFREYAVVNCSVEIAKYKNIYHGFINAVLKKISKDKDKLIKTAINYNELPRWFKIQTKNLTDNERKLFIDSFFKEPNLHLVFKSKKEFDKFEEKIIKTSENSGFLQNKRKIEEIVSYREGNWWVQDFSSSFPIRSIAKLHKYKKFLDMCAAPGGKSFQILSRNLNITLNDKSKARIKLMKNNLRRLKFNPRIINKNFENLDSNIKFDFIILDAPCSSIGTIRKNPEIFFKSKEPKITELVEIQSKMLKKASEIVELNGIILYMVCSFLYIETEHQIKDFLDKANSFRLEKFDVSTKIFEHTRLIKNSCILTIPNYILDNTVDGYFAALLKKVR